MPLAVCHERDELEREISASLRAMSRNSRTASEIAQQSGPQTDVQFKSLHNEDIVLRERIETLKYCLQLHKDCHGC
jgi:hypothetical protein